MAWLSTRWAILTVVVSTTWIGVACIDPRNDYDDWVAATGPLRGVVPGDEVMDAGAIETSAPEGGFSTENYLMACVSDLVDLRTAVQEAAEFTATATYTPLGRAERGARSTSATRPSMVGATSITQVAPDANTISGERTRP